MSQKTESNLESDYAENNTVYLGKPSWFNPLYDIFFQMKWQNEGMRVEWKTVLNQSYVSVVFALFSYKRCPLCQWSCLLNYYASILRKPVCCDFSSHLQIISDEMLYLMTLEPGYDMGNVVAWKDFTRPESIPEEQFKISKTDINFRVETSKRGKINWV